MSNKNKEIDASAASMVMQIFTDSNNWSANNYINFSVYGNIAEDAPVASMVMHQFEKLGLHGLPGSIPGWGASASFQISFGGFLG